MHRVAALTGHLMAAANTSTATTTVAPATTAAGTALSSLSSHVLNTTTGKTGAGVPIVLHAVEGKDTFRELFIGVTDADGRVTGKQFPALAAGVYRLTFDTDAYFAAQKTECFYPKVEVTFRVTLNAQTGKGQHFHVPCLLSPYGFSTYRGS